MLTRRKNKATSRQGATKTCQHLRKLDKEEERGEDSKKSDATATARSRSETGKI